MSSVHMPVLTPCRFDVILDGVGRETEHWALGLLKPWSGAKYVTLVTPLLQDTDSLGLLSGTFQAGFSLHNTAFQVNTSGFIEIWCGNSMAIHTETKCNFSRFRVFLKQFNLATLQTASSVTVNNSRCHGVAVFKMFWALQPLVESRLQSWLDKCVLLNQHYVAFVQSVANCPLPPLTLPTPAK